MKKALFAASLAGVLVLAGFGAQAIASGPAWPAKCANPNHSILTGFKCADAHINNLHKTFKALKSRVSDLEGFIDACLIPTDVTQTPGYGFDSNGDGTVDTTHTALDLSPTGTTPTLIVVAANPQCVSAANRLSASR